MVWLPHFAPPSRSSFVSCSFSPCLTAAQHSTAPHSTGQHSTTRHNVAQHITAQQAAHLVLHHRSDTRHQTADSARNSTPKATCHTPGATRTTQPTPTRITPHQPVSMPLNGLCIAHIRTRRQLHTAHMYMKCHLAVYPFAWLFSPALRIGRPTSTPDASVDFFARASVCLPVCLCTRFSLSLSLSLSLSFPLSLSPPRFLLSFLLLGGASSKPVAQLCYPHFKIAYAKSENHTERDRERERE